MITLTSQYVWGKIGEQEKELNSQVADLRQQLNFKLTLHTVWYL